MKRFAAPIVAALLCVSLNAQAAVAAVSPDLQLQEFEMSTLEKTVPALPVGRERDYFAGVLANRSGHVAESIALLKAALPGLRSSNPARAAVALQTLADDYNKSFLYAQAASAGDDLLAHFATQLPPSRLQTVKDGVGVMHLLQGSPAQTIAFIGSTRLKTERNPLGALDTQLTVNGVSGPWLLDTAAKLSVVSRSFAERLGLKLLPGFGQTAGGVTGIENPLQMSVLPILEMGGATLRNVAIVVLDDANLQVDLGTGQTYQVSGIVGFPVFQALGTVTFLHDGTLVAGDAPPARSVGARMYMKQLTPVIECVVDGKSLPFTFDTGAARTNLSVRYYNAFAGKATTWRPLAMQNVGPGGVVTRDIYVQPVVNLGVGDETASLRNIPVFPAPMGSDIDELYGNIGQDMVANFSSFTLDFTAMTFSLGMPLSPNTTS